MPLAEIIRDDDIDFLPLFNILKAESTPKRLAVRCLVSAQLLQGDPQETQHGSHSQNIPE
ncbi:MAG: hypothetical protein ACJAVZ_000346 [Afipia broomeae]|jgi:hypothetical protein